MNKKMPTMECGKVAILFTEWSQDSVDNPNLGVSNDLLPICGKHMLQRVIEKIVDSGFLTIHVLLTNSSGEVRDFLGSGERWGCSIQYHQNHPQSLLREKLKTLTLADDDHYLVANSHTLPILKKSFYEPGNNHQGKVAVHGNEKAIAWTGWGIFRGDWLMAQQTVAQLHENAMDESSPKARCLTHEPYTVITLADLVNTSRRILNESNANNEGNYIHISRGSKLHDSVQLVAPVFIGRHVKVSANTIIGPNVVIGDGAYIDKGAHLTNSIVMPDTYIGEILELKQVVVRGKSLANIQLNTVIEVSDSHLLSVVSDVLAQGPWEYRFTYLFDLIGNVFRFGKQKYGTDKTLKSAEVVWD